MIVQPFATQSALCGNEVHDYGHSLQQQLVAVASVWGTRNPQRRQHASQFSGSGDPSKASHDKEGISTHVAGFTLVSWLKSLTYTNRLNGY